VFIANLRCSTQYVTRLRLVTYFLPPALERIKNTYCMVQRPFLYFYIAEWSCHAIMRSCWCSWSYVRLRRWRSIVSVRLSKTIVCIVSRVACRAIRLPTHVPCHVVCVASGSAQCCCCCWWWWWRRGGWGWLARNGDNRNAEWIVSESPFSAAETIHSALRLSPLRVSPRHARHRPVRMNQSICVTEVGHYWQNCYLCWQLFHPAPTRQLSLGQRQSTHYCAASK